MVLPIRINYETFHQKHRRMFFYDYDKVQRDIMYIFFKYINSIFLQNTSTNVTKKKKHSAKPRYIVFRAYIQNCQNI